MQMVWSCQHHIAGVNSHLIELRMLLEDLETLLLYRLLDCDLGVTPSLMFDMQPL
jgi:hypothetical protein